MERKRGFFELLITAAMKTVWCLLFFVFQETLMLLSYQLLLKKSCLICLL
ncbi:hypothetical protein HanPSC8_Chr15g0681451 [Helianthus annuus]|nr:hypothetical protein HanPSC8_Chr15g0681451 [Helianthus annuus]